MKSHLTLDDHLAKGGEAWAWHASKFADELAVAAKETHDWDLDGS